MHTPHMAAGKMKPDWSPQHPVPVKSDSEGNELLKKSGSKGKEYVRRPGHFAPPWPLQLPVPVEPLGSINDNYFTNAIDTFQFAYASHVSWALESRLVTAASRAREKQFKG